MAYGTLSIQDLLATQATVVQLGLDVVYESIDTALAFHNKLLAEKFSTLVDRTTERARRYGGPDTMTMEKVDEFGTANAQKISAGSRVEFPLYQNEIAVQWTKKYLERATARELAEQFIAAQDADVRAIERDIKIAAFTSTNKTVVDRLRDNLSLSVKALVNADSAPIPVAPDGTTFTASTHTHYLFTAGTSLAAADIDALVTTVVEHVVDGKVMLYINKAQESAVRALASAGQFIAITPTMVTPAYTVTTVVAPLDTMSLNNRLIGYWGTSYAEVWVKPWIPAGYLFAYIAGAAAGAGKPFVYRYPENGSADLVIAAEDDIHPLRARILEREYGIGVWNRTNGAVSYIDTGAAGAYVIPSIT